MKLRDYFFLSRENRTFTCKKDSPKEEKPSVKGAKRKCTYSIVMAHYATTSRCETKKWTVHSRKEAKSLLIQLILWHTTMRRTELEKL